MYLRIIFVRVESHYRGLVTCGGVGYNAAMRLRRKQRPSYEQGELRDKEIEKLQDPDYQASDLKKLLIKAAKSRQKRSR